jgi:hypothetical protein
LILRNKRNNYELEARKRREILVYQFERMGQVLGDVKITARELDAMGIFIIDTPKVPDNVVPIRRTNEI